MILHSFVRSFLSIFIPLALIKLILNVFGYEIASHRVDPVGWELVLMISFAVAAVYTMRVVAEEKRLISKQVREFKPSGLPYCPNCRREYSQSKTKCSHCDMDLINGEGP